MRGESALSVSFWLAALLCDRWIPALNGIREQAKSEGYKRSRNTRVFAVAVSADESGEDALDWLMSELVEDGDEVVAIRVIELAEGGESPVLLFVDI